jgi:hypothetical protein
MRRVVDRLSWLLGSVAIAVLFAGLLLATSQVAAQNPGPAPNCTGCIGFQIPNGPNTHCANTTWNGTQCAIVFQNQSLPGTCLVPLPPAGPCVGCTCTATVTIQGTFCNCR